MRLRGYLDAPDTSIYWHNVPWSANMAENERWRRSRYEYHRGSNYHEEDPRMWNSTVGVRYSKRVLAAIQNVQ